MTMVGATQLLINKWRIYKWGRARRRGSLMTDVVLARPVPQPFHGCGVAFGHQLRSSPTP